MSAPSIIRTLTVTENLTGLTLRVASQEGKMRKATPREKVGTLLIKIEQCTHILAPLQREVQQWKNEYKEACDSDESLSLALGKLVGSVIHKAIRDHQDDMFIQDQLLALEDDVIEILEEIIPEEETPEDFIKMCKILAAKELKFKQGIESVKKASEIIQQNSATKMTAAQGELRASYISQQATISALSNTKQQKSGQAVTAIAALNLLKEHAEESNNQNKEKEVLLGNRLISLQSAQDQMVQRGMEILGDNI